MLLARGFFVLSVLAVVSSASVSLLSASPTGPQAEPPQHQRYFGPSQFA